MQLVARKILSLDVVGSSPAGSTIPEVVELVDTPDLGSGAVFACSMQVRRLSSGYSFTLWNSRRNYDIGKHSVSCRI